MTRFLHKLRSPGGIACLIATLALLVGISCVALENPKATLTTLLATVGAMGAMGAAFTGSPASGTEIALVNAGQKTGVPTRIEFIPFSYVHSLGAGTGEVNLAWIPPGLVRILPDLCRYACSQFAAGALLHFGTRAYVDIHGVTIAEDDNALGDNINVNGGATDAIFATPTAPWLEIDSQAGVLFYAMVDTGNIEDGDTIDGYLAVQRVG